MADKKVSNKVQSPHGLPKSDMIKLEGGMTMPKPRKSSDSNTGTVRETIKK